MRRGVVYLQVLRCSSQYESEARFSEE
ncbi:hypothetical protein A2U01_0104987, partial [Trifolium medium]|nr:hypothetical protein [Trifolium medium]